MTGEKIQRFIRGYVSIRPDSFLHCFSKHLCPSLFYIWDLTLKKCHELNISIED